MPSSSAPSRSTGLADAVSALTVQVVFSPAERTIDSSDVGLENGACVLDAIRASGVLQRHPAIDLTRQRVGIWGRACEPDARLADGDRVEIYRPLAADPKEARRARHRSLLAARRR
jgi:uncharacterized protein